MILSPEQWDRLWNAGLPLVILAYVSGKLWVTWRRDVDRANADREKNRIAIENLTKAFTELNDRISSFFLSHFP